MKTKIFTPSKRKLAQAVALGIVGLAASHAQAANYTFSDLGGLNDLANSAAARGINNLGQVVGSQGASAVVWNGSAWSALANPDGTEGSVGYGINDLGQVVGTSTPTGQDAAVSVRWDNGVPTRLDTLNSYDDSAAINNSGQISGMIWANASTFHPVTWAAGSTAFTELPTLGGDWGYVFNNHSINGAGEVVGSTQLPGGEALHGTAWLGGVAYDLGTLGGTNSEANSINTIGQIVGDANNADDNPRPVLWNDASSAPIDLGTLGGSSGMATAVNDNGLIAGWSDTADGTSHMTLWDHGQVIDLTQFIPPELIAAGWHSLQGGGNNSILSSDWLDMNNAGAIVSNLYDNSNHSIPILLTPAPVPVPGAVWLFGSALAGFMGMKRRKQG